MEPEIIKILLLEDDKKEIDTLNATADRLVQGKGIVIYHYQVITMTIFHEANL